MKVRPATLADVPAIAVLVDSYAQRGQVLPRKVEEIQDTLSNWLVAEIEGQILACGSLLHYTPQLAEVRSLTVRESATGNGLGSAVLKELITLARDQKVPTLFALTRVAPLFIKQNFETNDKALFPEKIWKDCMLCPIQEDCDEIAVVLDLNTGDQ